MSQIENDGYVRDIGIVDIDQKAYDKLWLKYRVDDRYAFEKDVENTPLQIQLAIRYLVRDICLDAETIKELKQQLAECQRKAKQNNCE